ncbi:MAG: pectinesterase family protein [Bacteroidia bacterium]
MKKAAIILLFLFVGIESFAQYKTEITVATDGSGDYTSIQEAIDNAKSFPDRRITISIKKGLYREKVTVHAWNPHITLKGEAPGETIIIWADHFEKINRSRNSTFHTPTLLVQGDDFSAENLTIENAAGEVGQAIAVSVEADRAQFTNCRILGNQDTLYVDGANTRQHFVGCYIAGTTDFIFGAATVLFEDCEIHSKSDSYVTAASTPEGREFGLVFLRCKLTADPQVSKVYLGRPWRDFAKTVFIDCEMGPHILPEGWHNWGSPEKEQTTFYAEYGSKGEGASASGRVEWSYTLTDKQAKKYTPKNILKPFPLPAWD